MDYDHHCTEIVTQAELLSTGIEGADLRAPVPSCPDWTLGMLLRHVGGGHRWAEEMVRTRATGFLADDQVRKLDGDDSADVPATWLMDGATRLAHTLRTAGPGTKVWTPLDLDGTTSFWARRFAPRPSFTAPMPPWQWIRSSPSPRMSHSMPSTSGWSSTRYRSTSSTSRRSGTSSALAEPSGSRPPTLQRHGSNGIEIAGDGELLDLWLGHVGFA
jgi:hypothetical protein